MQDPETLPWRKAWQTRRARCAPSAPRCGCPREPSPGLCSTFCWAQHSRGTQMSCVCSVFFNITSSVAAAACPRLSSHGGQRCRHSLLGAHPGWEFLQDSIAWRWVRCQCITKSRSLRGSWQETSSGGHDNITFNIASSSASVSH